jgi:DNA polymerase-3 subunit alpha
MAGFTWTEVDKLRKAISKKSGRDFDDACNLFKEKSLIRGIPEPIVDSVLALMAKFGGYAFNRSHACAYALLSYWTAWLRYYYKSEWLAACIQIDRLDEDKLAILKKECDMDKIVIKEPNINESSVTTLVNKKGEILLPLSVIKGVGARAEDIIAHQPYDSLEDFAERARPNKMLVSALAEASALDVLSDVLQFDYLEDFLEHWESIVANRNERDKQAAKLKRFNDRNSVSLDKIFAGKKDASENNSDKLKNLLSDDLFD